MRLFLSLSVFCLTAKVLLAQDVSTPQKRTETLDLARRLLTTQPIRVDVAAVLGKNPFNLQAPAPVQVVASEPVSAVVLADRDLLITLASSITPSGSMRLGDTPILLFGQKKFKVGDALPIVFQGVSRELVITSIEPTSFTLRLNNEEITRPIKPSANKP